jgi:hypothetical protein
MSLLKSFCETRLRLKKKNHKKWSERQKNIEPDHGRMVSPMNADLRSLKPFTISLKGQFENSPLFSVIKWF